MKTSDLKVGSFLIEKSESINNKSTLYRITAVQETRVYFDYVSRNSEPFSHTKKELDDIFNRQISTFKYFLANDEKELLALKLKLDL